MNPRDVVAMRAAFDRLEKLGERPAEVRRSFITPDATVRRAVQIVNNGGRALLMGDEPDVDLLSNGWLHFGFGAMRGWVEMDERLLTAFAEESMR